MLNSIEHHVAEPIPDHGQLPILRKELAGLQAFIDRASVPRDPFMQQQAEIKMVQLSCDIARLERAAGD